jgi:hypothetical protein
MRDVSITHLLLSVIAKKYLGIFVFVLCGCSAMHSRSSLKMPTVNKGLTYHLPKSYYRISLGGGTAATPKIEVSHEIQPDTVSFSLDISRNPLVDRVQTYGVNSKGLLTSAKSEDTGRVAEILQSAASSVVAFAQPGLGSGLPGFGVKAMDLEEARPKSNNQLSPAEYTIFIEELSKMNCKLVCEAGGSIMGRSMPSESGNFVMNFTAPKANGVPLGNVAIRARLVEAGGRLKKVVNSGEIDDQILAAGVIARPMTYGKMSYVIYVKKEAVNRLRQGTPKSEEIRASDALENQQSANRKESERAAKIDAEIDALIERNAAQEKQRSTVEASGKSMEALVETAQRSSAEAKASLTTFHKGVLGFDRSDDYWTKYSELLDALQSDGAQDPAVRKAQVAKAIAMNSTIQRLANAAVQTANSQIAANDAKIAELRAFSDSWPDLQRKNGAKLEKARHELRVANFGTAPATQNIPIVVTSDRMPVVDEASAQVIPLRRSLVDKVTSSVTMADGVVTEHAINEPSEVLGTVKIPLKVIEAVLDTVNTLWTKKDDVQSSQNSYLEAQKEYIEARAALEEARAAELETTP